MSTAHSDPPSDSSGVDIVTTGCGGARMLRAALRSGILVGYESHRTWPLADADPSFIDWPFSRSGGSVAEHITATKTHEPAYAVAPDIEGEWSLDASLDVARQLDRYAETVIVVPKSVAPSRIPERYRVGIPAQEKYGGVPRPVWEYRNCGDVHLLGGGPTIHDELSNYVSIGSLDTAAPLKAAKFGAVWTANGWADLDLGYYDSITKSFTNIRKRWDPAVSPPLAAPDPDMTDVGFPPADLLGDDESVPFPGRAHFYNDSGPDWEAGMTPAALRKR